MEERDLAPKEIMADFLHWSEKHEKAKNSYFHDPFSYTHKHEFSSFRFETN